MCHIDSCNGLTDSEISYSTIVTGTLLELSKLVKMLLKLVKKLVKDLLKCLGLLHVHVSELWDRKYMYMYNTKCTPQNTLTCRLSMILFCIFGEYNK